MVVGFDNMTRDEKLEFYGIDKASMIEFSDRVKSVSYDEELRETDKLLKILKKKNPDYNDIVKCLCNGASVRNFNVIKDALVGLMLHSDYNDYILSLLIRAGLVLDDEASLCLLFQAIFKSKPNYLELLLLGGANPNVREKGGLGRTPLTCAAEFTNKVKFVKLLLEYGADLNFLDLNGRTIKGVATFYGTTDIIEYLNEIGFEREYLHGIGFDNSSINKTSVQIIEDDKSKISSVNDELFKETGKKLRKIFRK